MDNTNNINTEKTETPTQTVGEQAMSVDEINAAISVTNGNTLIVDADGGGVGILKEEKEVLENKPIIEKLEPSKTVTQEFEIYSPLNSNDDPNDIGISFPSERADRIEKALLAMPNVDNTSTPQGIEWVSRIQAARYTVPYKGWFTDTVDREGSDWKQYIASEKGPLAPGGLKYNDPINTKLTGERAILRVKALTGLGRVVSIPLWHSGFWISFKAPNESTLLELHARISEEKIRLGRLTYGLAFANNSVIYSGWLIDCAMAHIYETSLRTDINVDLRDLISVLDLPTLIWGLANSIWPTGFPYARSVISKDGNTTKVIKERMNIGKMFWPDNSEFTQWQIAHMSQRYNNSMTVESLERYRNEFTRGKGRIINLSDNINISLKVPNLNEYLLSGQKWVNNIVSMCDNLFTKTDDPVAREEYIMDQSKASNMRQFSHFVENMDADGSLIEDTDSLDGVIDAVSASDEIRNNYFKGIKKFIEDSTVAVIAIVVTEDGEVSDLPRFPHLLPIDVMSVFFILLVQKVSQIQRRM